MAAPVVQKKISVDDYIVDSMISRIGVPHYEKSKFTSKWKKQLRILRELFVPLSQALPAMAQANDQDGFQSTYVEDLDGQLSVLEQMQKAIADLAATQAALEQMQKAIADLAATQAALAQHLGMAGGPASAPGPAPAAPRPRPLPVALWGQTRQRAGHLGPLCPAPAQPEVS